MIILSAAAIYTLDDSLPGPVTALAIREGRILAAGQVDALCSEFPSAHVQDLGGATIWPGLTDAHIHLLHYALGLQKVDCETSTLAECLRRVAERSRSLSPDAWLLGHGWNQNVWPDAGPSGFGSAADLDAIAPDNPVYLTAKSLHAAWANRAALRLAGLHDGSPDPEGGQLGRDAAGALDGILFESAMGLVADVIPPPTPEANIAALRAALPDLHRMGLTSVHDFDRRHCFLALQTLHERDQLSLRVLKSIPLDDLPHAIGLGLRSGFGDDFLRIGPVKAFADGALGPQTAAMFQPYEGSPTKRGFLLMDAEALYEHARQAVQNGFNMAVHAIGDLANHEVLNAYERLRHDEREAGLLRPLRHRIEHLQVLHPADAARLAQLDVIASMQPIHAPSDMFMADRFWGERAALSYAWRTQLKAGARLAFGSDAPVESPNPFWGLHAAVTRQRQDGAPAPDGWRPEQRLSLLEALRGFTSGPAYAAGMEDRLGRLAPGCYADLIVLDTDPFSLPPAELAQLLPQATMVNGEWV